MTPLMYGVAPLGPGGTPAERLAAALTPKKPVRRRPDRRDWLDRRQDRATRGESCDSSQNGVLILRLDDKSFCDHCEPPNCGHAPSCTPPGRARRDGSQRTRYRLQIAFIEEDDRRWIGRLEEAV
jgi:hypothetical protein